MTTGRRLPAGSSPAAAAVGSLVLWVTAAAALPALPAQEEAPRVAFEKELERVRQKMDQGEWKNALGRLDRALKSHAEADYVLMHLGEIELAYKRCTFWKERGEPDPSKWVAGEVLDYDARTGRIEIRYVEDRPHDFVTSGFALLLPIEFSGPYSVEVSDAASPTLVVCARQRESIQVSFGRVFHLGRDHPKHSKPTERWVKMISKLKDRDGELVETLREKDFTTRRNLEEKVFKVQVTSNQVKASFNGKSLLSCSKPRDLWGSFAVPLGGPHGTVVVEGLAGDWIQRKRDETFREEWEAFESKWVLADHLPAWLAEAAAASPPAASGPELRHGLPADSPRGEIETWNRAVEAIEKGRFATALEEVERVETEFGQRELLRAAALRGLRRPEEALGVLARCVERYPDSREAHQDHARLLLATGRFEEARDAVASAVSAGIPPMELQAVSITANKALHGPSWSTRSTWSSRHYTVSSDLSEAICRTVALELEETFRHVSRRLGVGEHEEGRKFQVFVFSGEASYLDYVEDVFGGRGESTLGMYSPYLKQLLVLDSPRRADFLHTVRHEGFHQFLDAVLDEPPTWLNEGLAEYFAASRTDQGSWRDGRLEERRLEVLRTPTPSHPRLEQRLTPLARFLHLSHGTFMRGARYAYSQAWAFVHFLRHSSRENQERLRILIERLLAGVENRRAIEEAFEGCDLEALDEEFRRYVEKL